MEQPQFSSTQSVRFSFAPWLACFSASLFFFYEFIQGNMFASIADSIMHDFHIEADKMAYLSSTYYLSNVLLIFVAGRILDNCSAKKTILFAMLMCVVSTFFLAATHSFYIALLCRFVAGTGSAFCFLGPIRLASRWFPPRKMAFVTGVIVTFAMTGGMIAQYPLTKLVAFIGWREALIKVGWLGVGMLMFMYFTIVENSEFPKNSERYKKIKLSVLIKDIYLNGQALRAAFYTTLMNTPIALLGAMIGTLYLQQRLSISKENASMINSFLFLGAIVGGPLFGFLSDKWTLRIWPMVVGVAGAFLLMISILYMPVSFSVMKILFFLLGVFTGAQVISYALVAESSPFALTATAVSVVSLMTQAGYVMFQNIFSHLLMYHGEMQFLQGVPVYSLNDYQFALIILPAGLIVAAALLSGLKETYCRHIEEIK